MRQYIEQNSSELHPHVLVLVFVLYNNGITYTDFPDLTVTANGRIGFVTSHVSPHNAAAIKPVRIFSRLRHQLAWPTHGCDLLLPSRPPSVSVLNSRTSMVLDSQAIEPVRFTGTPQQREERHDLTGKPSGEALVPHDVRRFYYSVTTKADNNVSQD